MDKQTRENQDKVRKQKAEQDKHIWAKVPAKKITREEAGQARRTSSQREIVDENA